MKKIALIIFFGSLIIGCHLPEVDSIVTCLRYCDTYLTSDCQPGGSSNPMSDKCSKEKEEQLICEDQCR